MIQIVTLMLLLGLNMGCSSGEEKTEFSTLMYHSFLTEEQVQNEDIKKGNVHVDVAKFEEQMAFLAENNYNTMLASEFLALMEDGTPIPEKTVLIFVDDGYLDNYTVAYPVIQEHGIKMNISVVVSSSEVVDKSSPIYAVTQNHITQDQMREMEASGLVEMVSHSYDGHRFIQTGKNGQGEGAFYVTKMYLEDEKRMETDTEYETRIRTDIVAAKKLLDEWVDRDIDTFVYPYGRHNDTLRRVLEEEGFRFAITTKAGQNTEGEFLPLEVRRYNVDYDDGIEEFAKKLN